MIDTCVSYWNCALLDPVAGLVVCSTSIDCMFVVDASAYGEPLNQTIAHLDDFSCKRAGQAEVFGMEVVVFV